jgi:peptidoglycan hydrolase-like protein with peptidoglycan-binding domain
MGRIHPTMSERISKMAIALFLVLSAAVGLNISVLQPVPQHQLISSESGWGAVQETATLSVPEIDRQRIGALGNSIGRPVATVPGVAQRLVVVPPPADEREMVRAVQRALEARGYETGGTDGIVGPVTQAAILAYEIDHGLRLTATPSTGLIKVIQDGSRDGPGGVAPASLKPAPAAENLVKSVQQQLAQLGYPAGKPDGVLGEGTIAAIRQFEKQQSMPDTGRISGELVIRLSRLSRTAGAP